MSEPDNRTYSKENTGKYSSRIIVQEEKNTRIIESQVFNAEISHKWL